MVLNSAESAIKDFSSLPNSACAPTYARKISSHCDRNVTALALCKPHLRLSTALRWDVIKAITHVRAALCAFWQVAGAHDPPTEPTKHFRACIKGCGTACGTRKR